MRSQERENEQGFILVGLIVAIFIILLVLGVAAPKVARDLRREREVEMVHRGNQYVRAVQLYYRKIGSYPGSMDQLEKTNNIRFLRQRYVDPMTGKPDWRLIKVGEAKTTVKGFFGQPLAGLTPGLGSAAGMASSGAIGAGAAGGTAGSTGSSDLTFGSPSSSGPGSSSSAYGASSPGGGVGSSMGTPGAGSTDASGVGGSSGSTGGIGSQSATGFSGGGTPFVGVGSVKTGESIIDLNEQTTYQTWEFIYDPRIEQLKAKASLFGGGPATSSSSSTLGSAAGSASAGQSGFSTGGGYSSSPTSPTSPTTTSPTSSPPSTPQ
jgi:type II secretory pathway pseudopilin PulG